MREGTPPQTGQREAAAFGELGRVVLQELDVADSGAPSAAKERKAMH